MVIEELVNGNSLTLTTSASPDMSGIRGTGLYGALVHTGHGSIRGAGAQGHLWGTYGALAHPTWD